MARNRHMAVGVLFGGILSAWLVATDSASAQAAQVEVVPAPVPTVQPLLQPARASVVVGVPSASIRIAAPVAAVPSVVIVPQAVAPAYDQVYTYRPRRAVRQARRNGYVAVPQVLPYQATIIYPYAPTVWAPSPTAVYGQVIVPETGVYRETPRPVAGPLPSDRPTYFEPQTRSEPSPSDQPTYRPWSAPTGQPTLAIPPTPAETLPGPGQDIETVPLPPGEPAPYGF